MSRFEATTSHFIHQETEAHLICWDLLKLVLLNHALTLCGGGDKADVCAITGQQVKLFRLTTVRYNIAFRRCEINTSTPLQIEITTASANKNLTYLLFILKHIPCLTASMISGSDWSKAATQIAEKSKYSKQCESIKNSLHSKKQYEERAILMKQNNFDCKGIMKKRKFIHVIQMRYQWRNQHCMHHQRLD